MCLLLNSDQIQTAIKEADSGKGVLLIVKNYTGDALNFDMAKELAAMDDIEVESVIVDDDIAVENSTYTAGKRGVAGTVLVHKIVGDAARNGASLAELKELGEKVVQATKTIGVALRAATVPEVGNQDSNWEKMRLSTVLVSMVSQAIVEKRCSLLKYWQRNLLLRF